MKRVPYLLAFVGLTMALVALPGSASAQTSSSNPANSSQSNGTIKALIKEIQELKAGQQAMQKDITEIKEKLTPKGPASSPLFKEAGIDIGIEGDPVMGDKDAKVTLVEFADYQCPYCGYASQQIYPFLVAEYVKTGKVKYVFHDFPLEQVHSNAFKASEAARCAGDQGKYWEMHDKLFQSQKALDAQGLADAAQGLSLNVTKFQQCLDNAKYEAKIHNDVETGVKIGVRGTPSFLLGLSGPDGTTLKATRKINGATTYASLKAAIDALLSPPGGGPREKAGVKPAEKREGGAQ